MTLSPARLTLASLVVVAALYSACFYDWDTPPSGGEGGEGGEGGSAGSGGEGGSTGGGSCECDAGVCNSVGDCCWETWSVSLAREPSILGSSPEDLSLDVGITNDSGDGGSPSPGRVERRRTCDGSPVTETSGTDFDRETGIRGIVRLDNALAVVANMQTTGQIRLLDPITLDEQDGSPIDLPIGGWGDAGAPDTIRNAIRGPDDAVWMNLDDGDAQLLQYVPSTGQVCGRYDIQSDPDARGHGMTVTGDRIVNVWVREGDEKETTVDFIDPSACTDCTCTAGALVERITIPEEFEGYGVAAANGAVFVVGTVGDAPTMSARIVRVESGTTTSCIYDRQALLVEGLTRVAVDDSTLYAVGMRGGTEILNGTAMVLSVPVDFDDECDPVVRAIDNAVMASKLAVDDDGLYVGGIAEDKVSGFLVKCIKDPANPDCPAAN